MIRCEKTPVQIDTELDGKGVELCAEFAYLGCTLMKAIGMKRSDIPTFMKATQTAMTMAWEERTISHEKLQ